MPTKRVKPSFGREAPKPLHGVPNDEIRAKYAGGVFEKIENEFSISEEHIAIHRKTVLHAAACYLEFRALVEEKPTSQEQRAEIDEIQQLAGELLTKIQLLSDPAYRAYGLADVPIQNEALRSSGQKLLTIGIARSIGGGEIEFPSGSDVSMSLAYVQYRCHLAKKKIKPNSRGRPSKKDLSFWFDLLKIFWCDILDREIKVVHGNKIYKSETLRYFEAIMMPLDPNALPSIPTLLRRARSKQF